MAKVLALDFGASSGRAVLGEYENGKLSLKEIHRFSNEPVLLNGILYWNALSLFDNIKKALKKVSAQNIKIDAIGIDTWGVDFGLIDEDGKLIENPIHYRSSKISETLKEKISAEELFKLTGINEQPFNATHKIMMIKNSAAFNNCKKLLFMPDLMNYLLCGEMRCEKTILSTSQLAAPKAEELSSEVLSALGISKNLFAKTVSPCAVVGKIKEEIKQECALKNDVPVVAVASHDTASAYAAVKSENCAIISSGTWSLIGAVINEPILSLDAFNANYSNERAADGNIKILKNIMGMWLIQEVKRELDERGEILSFSELVSKAKESTCNSIIDVNDNSFYEPNFMIEKIQNYCRKTKQTEPKTVGEIALVVYCSLAAAYKNAVIDLEKIINKKVDEIYIIGGGSNNDFLNELTKKETGKKVFCGLSEASSVGNILCQLVALKEISSLNSIKETAKNSFPFKEF